MNKQEKEMNKQQKIKKEMTKIGVLSGKSSVKSWLTAAVVMLFAGAFFSRCASIGRLEGGPKDTIPPVVLGMMPENFTESLTSKRIAVEFNEYIKLKDQQKELYTSPAMKKKPTLLMRGKTLFIDIKDDTLLPNTTYAIEFGGAVTDNNEGNPLHGFRYVFSTGGPIDSLFMSGYTEDSEKADSLGRSFIYFFEADSVPEPKEYDSTIFNYKPSKIARSNGNGIFIAQNLKPVDYRIYAIYDDNDNQTYEPGVDKVGFVDGVYNPIEMPPFGVWYDSLRRYVSADPQIYFRMFTDESFVRQSLQDHLRPDQHKILLYFATRYPDIKQIHLDGINPRDIIIEPQSSRRDTLTLWLKTPSEMLPDTIRGFVRYMKHDSVRKLQEDTAKLRLTWRLIESREQERERERLEKEKAKAEAEGVEWREPPRRSTFKMENFQASTEVNPEQDLSIEFATPLLKFDSMAVEMLSWGSGGDTLPESVHFIPDTLSPRKWKVRTQWNAKRSYQLYFPTDALVDITGEGNDSITMNMTVSDKEKFAVLNLRVQPRHPDYKYIIQLTEASSNKVLRELRDAGAGVHTINYVPAGEMRIRIIEDMNANGRWDGGNLVERRQSERAEFYKNENEEEIMTAKTGWEFDITLDMSRIFAPVTMEQLIERLDKREEARVLKLEEEQRKKALEGKNNNSGGFGGMGGGLGGMMGGMTGGMGGGMTGGMNF